MNIDTEKIKKCGNDIIKLSNDLNDIIELFNQIKVTTGLYAIKGNHDYSNNNFDLVFSQTDFKVLNNSYDLIYYHSANPILMTGIGSNLQGDMDIGNAYSYNETDNIFTISLIFLKFIYLFPKSLIGRASSIGEFFDSQIIYSGS